MTKPPRHRPQPPWAAFRQPQRSPASGKHRRTAPPAHSNSAGEPSGGTGRTAKVTPLGPGPKPFFYPGRGALIPFDPPKRITLDSIPYAGVRTGELIGWRMWFIQEDGFLCSMSNTDYVWKPEEIASGDVYQDLSDSFGFYRQIFGGIYAFKEKEQLYPEVDNLRRVRFPHQVMVPRESSSSHWNYLMMQAFGGPEETVSHKTLIGLAIGSVKLWGEVFEHETGYRAQFAKIEEIRVSYSHGYSPDLACDLRRRYHVQ